MPGNYNKSGEIVSGNCPAGRIVRLNAREIALS